MLFFFSSSNFAFSQIKNTSQLAKNIKVVSNFNIETLEIVFRLALSNSMEITHHPLVDVVMPQLETYKTHSAVKKMYDLVVEPTSPFGDDFFVEMLLHYEPFPKLKKKHLFIFPKQFEQYRKDADSLIFLLNDFYKEAHLQVLFEKYAYLYEKAKNEIVLNLPSKGFIGKLERYYRISNKSYTIIPSLMVYGWGRGIGPSVSTSSGKEIYQIVSANTVIDTNYLKDGKTNYGFNNKKWVEELSVHEFGHSFINPYLTTDSCRKLITESEHLFTESLKEAMSKQGYTSWNVCLIEHIVRLGEIRFAKKYKSAKEANRLREEYVQKRKFILIPYLENQISEYENNPNKYKSIQFFLPFLLRNLKAIKARDIEYKM